MAGRGLTAADWEALSSRALRGERVRVIYGRSRTQVVRLESRTRGAPRVLKLHAMFAQAPPEVQGELVEWLRSPRRAARGGSALKRWVDDRLAEIEGTEPRAIAIRPRGRVHDLEEIARELRQGELGGDFAGGARWPRITWGRRGRSQSRFALRLGSYDRASGVVRIHLVLDREEVPRFFVRYVLFHELLHAALGEEDGMHRHHGPRFRARERSYPELERALEWERRNVAALIARARRTPGQARAEKRDATALRAEQSNGAVESNEPRVARVGGG